jgi:hypothetical protein
VWVYSQGQMNKAPGGSGVLLRRRLRFGSLCDLGLRQMGGDFWWTQTEMKQKQGLFFVFFYFYFVDNR